jgi:hypothetical protein
MDPPHFRKSDQETHHTEKPDPDPYRSPNSGPMEAENRRMKAHPVAVTAHNRGREAHNGGLEDL